MNPRDLTAFATKRLNATLLTDARALWTGLGGAGSSAAADIVDIHAMTVQERASYLDMLDLFGDSRAPRKRLSAGMT